MVLLLNHLHNGEQIVVAGLLLPAGQVPCVYVSSDA